MRSTFAALALLCSCATPQAQTPPPAERGTPLQAPFLDIALGPAPASDESGAYAQIMSMLGREDLAPRAPPPVCESTAADPLDEISRRAAAARIVMINEAHDAPEHRAFIARVAQRLRNEGFSVFAAETFSDRVSDARAWPALADGFYAQEPGFGALLRQVRMSGYRLVHYEATGLVGLSPAERFVAREEGQAQNLIDRVLAQETNARMLVHVGYSHLREELDEQGNAWMARRLKERTGIDPLTIDQTEFSAPGDEHVVCTDLPASRGADLYLGAPVMDFANGRPAWRQRAGQQVVPLPGGVSSDTELAIVEARRASDPDEAVPEDRLLLRPGERLPLLLAPGQYRVEAWRQTTGWSAPVDVRVPPS